jgi:hypothetical protein
MAVELSELDFGMQKGAAKKSYHEDLAKYQ